MINQSSDLVEGHLQLIALSTVCVCVSYIEQHWAGPEPDLAFGDRERKKAFVVSN
jgi:hypothetical protein